MIVVEGVLNTKFPFTFPISSVVQLANVQESILCPTRELNLGCD